MKISEQIMMMLGEARHTPFLVSEDTDTYKPPSWEPPLPTLGTVGRRACPGKHRHLLSIPDDGLLGKAASPSHTSTNQKLLPNGL